LQANPRLSPLVSRHAAAKWYNENKTRSATVDEKRARRRKLLERLNAYDSGPHEDDRKAAKEAEIKREVRAEAERWPSTFCGRRVLNGV
jgi:hypothetical protein